MLHLQGFHTMGNINLLTQMQDGSSKATDCLCVLCTAFQMDPSKTVFGGKKFPKSSVLHGLSTLCRKNLYTLHKIEALCIFVGSLSFNTGTGPWGTGT